MAFFSWLRRHWSSWSRLGSAQTSATHTLQALPRPIGSPPITVMRAMSETATAATMMIAMRERTATTVAAAMTMTASASSVLAISGRTNSSGHRKTMCFPEDDTIDFYESLEGMRVEANNPLAISGPASFDEVGLAGLPFTLPGSLSPADGRRCRNPEPVCSAAR